ncbi:PepSY domain-containing protein [Tetragenococcus koreensis]|uniref:PepSY domain-containing protein n=1 Tax=Tetragenococcus koreensis TaxID=290335 RepID=A0AAN4UC20_9ENTE|nr:PepSY domain-containing protein [Tetragenococcus koreensis]AYW45720.1 lysis protein [Tetragenococcus koreensis]MCF1585535.1 PepSY domain-containing protein [Tetragenococcus koreensis]MCF1615081.1 PepSY domain-containing protein [Tetragenococcus koreensis]MCF1616909.1 PepSY domain-containing protein [Tetragenococcus koreensis]MCF1620126.1 PepSY domain-containing protein [Tetragenococcus koreensis]
MKKWLFYIIPLAAMLTLTACTQNDDEQTEQNSSTQTTTTTQTTQSTSSAMSSETTESQTEQSTSTSSQTEQSTSQSGESAAYDQDEISVTVADAIQIYQDELPDTDITEINLDRSNGKYYYEVEGLDDDTEYEMRIDAKTEDAEKQEEETLDPNEQDGKKREQDKVDLSDLLSIQEAATIATDEAGGGRAIDWSLDKELKITYWEVEVEDGQNETEVKINAQTGEVLETREDD